MLISHRYPSQQVQNPLDQHFHHVFQESHHTLKLILKFPFNNIFQKANLFLKNTVLFFIYEVSGNPSYSIFIYFEPKTILESQKCSKILA